MNPLVAPFLPGLSGTLGQQFTFARPPGRIRSRLALTPASPWPGPKKVHALTRPAASAPRGARSTTGIETPKQWRILARRPGGQWFNADTPVLRTTLPNAKDGARKWLAGMPLGSCVGLIRVIDNPYLPAISNLAAISWTECSRATGAAAFGGRLSPAGGARSPSKLDVLRVWQVYELPTGAQTWNKWGMGQGPSGGLTRGTEAQLRQFLQQLVIPGVRAGIGYGLPNEGTRWVFFGTSWSRGSSRQTNVAYGPGVNEP